MRITGIVTANSEPATRRSTKFEKVHTIRDIYDGIRTGTANLSGAAHYFASVFDDNIGDHTQHFRLYAARRMGRAQRNHRTPSALAR